MSKSIQAEIMEIVDKAMGDPQRYLDARERTIQDQIYHYQEHIKHDVASIALLEQELRDLGMLNVPPPTPNSEKAK